MEKEFKITKCSKPSQEILKMKQKLNQIKNPNKIKIGLKYLKRNNFKKGQKP